MKNQLTIIIPVYNASLYIESCLNSVIRQTNQDFDLLLINDGSTDHSIEIAEELLMQHERPYQLITLVSNQGHSYARNIAMNQVTTPYFMFLDADDMLAPYTLSVYLEYLDDKLDFLFAPIESFMPEIKEQFQNNELRVIRESIEASPSRLIEHHSICNVIFKTEIIQNNHLELNTSLNIYSDLSLLIDYSLSSQYFIQLSGIPFYYCGEVYDPFETPQLREQPFDIRFDAYVKAFDDALERIGDYEQMRKSILTKMREYIYREFEPSLFDITQRYQKNGELLSKITPLLKSTRIREENWMFRVELWLLSKKMISLSKIMNQVRYKGRLVKLMLSNSEKRAYAKYMLFHSNHKFENETIVFESFGGKAYNDSPKYIYEYMKKNYPSYNYYWVFQDIDNSILPNDCLKIKKGSPEYYDIYDKAHIWVSNARLPLFLRKKENQCYIQTWHGTPLKRLANDMTKVRMSSNTTTSKYKRNFYLATRRWDYLISPNAYSTNIFQSAFWMNPDQILEIGYPRNDIVVKRQNDVDFQNAIRQKLGIPSDKKVILYAPTWRDDEYIDVGTYKFELNLDLEKFKQKLQDDYIILLRMHYFIANRIDIGDMDGFAYDVSNYKDISELYLISDVLVTDYSSVMFDFGILKRPQLFFAYDVDNYNKELRGFYIDYFKDLPGPIYQTSDDLLKGLQNLKCIQSDYRSNIESFYQRFCMTETGKASEYIGELIHRKIQDNRLDDKKS